MGQKLSDAQLNKGYNLIKEYYEKYLKDKGVTLPRLKNGANYTKDALTLIYLAQGYPNTKVVTKRELTQFLRRYDSHQNDAQQARHLGAQKGWHILSGQRGDAGLNSGEYKLVDLKTIYPKFHGHRITNTEDWNSIKAQYDFRCATCGSKEGEENLHWPSVTKLQKSHMDPGLPLVAGNIIPQCQQCNRGDRNRWVYDERGRVIRVANPRVVERCALLVQKEIYKILKKKFAKKGNGG